MIDNIFIALVYYVRELRICRRRSFHTNTRSTGGFELLCLPPSPTSNSLVGACSHVPGAGNCLRALPSGLQQRCASRYPVTLVPYPFIPTFRRVEQDVTFLSECNVTYRTFQASHYTGAGAHYVAT